MDDAAMGQVIDGHTLRFERVVAHPPERVWRAISDENELRAWMRYPVSFEQREGGRVRFFEVRPIIGKIFIWEPPRSLAFSFWDAGAADAEERVGGEWHVRWDLEPDGGGCRITFQHRNLGGAHLWGLGDGWHGFIDQLIGYFDGALDEVLSNNQRDRESAAGLTAYRAHASRQLRDWAKDAANAGREAVSEGDRDAALAAIGRLELASAQFYEIARQNGPRPDYAPEPPPPRER
jgi:uncharacterized protein YndB with AHSA1/START domain